MENLTKIVARIQESDLFRDERTAIAALAEVKVTNNMLEGW